MREIAMKIGTRLTILYREPGKKPEEYYSKVVDMKENHLIIDYPIHKTTNKSKFFTVGTAISVSYVGSDQVVYQFSTKIAAKVKLNVPAIAIPIPKPEEIERIQRREFVRVDATVDVSIHRQDGKQPFTSVTTDLSGGGLSLIIPKDEQIELHEVVELWLVLGFHSGKYHYISTNAEIVFIQEKHGIHSASVKFISLKPKEQQLIISYCFEKQREMRKKELS